MNVSLTWKVLSNLFYVNRSRSLMPLLQSLDLSCGCSVMLKSPPKIHSQSLGRASTMICHKYFLSMGILGAYMLAMPMLPPSTPSSLIHTTLSSYNAPWSVTNLAYLCANKIPTPPLPAAFRLIQLFSLGAASKIQLAHPRISLFPRLSIDLPLNLCPGGGTPLSS